MGHTVGLNRILQRLGDMVLLNNLRQKFGDDIFVLEQDRTCYMDLDNGLKNRVAGHFRTLRTLMKRFRTLRYNVAEREGFEPSVPL